MAADLTWRKSSYSGPEGGECVEVAASAGAVHIRDSKDLSRAPLTVPATEWPAFLRMATRLTR